MGKKIDDLVNEILSNGSETDKQVLEQVLTGIAKKPGKKQTYINLLFGFETEWTADGIIMSMPVTPLAHNSLGIVHGGIITTLADTAMGTLANKIVSDGQAAVTAEIQVHFLKEATGKSLLCKCSVLHKGRKTMVFESKVYREDGILCGHSTGSFFVLPKRT
ncbi:PaaI family thioesterase [Peribacillus deserti]|uniref:PaaI family thioesterase n=1 Tax=Peribacillus deserti TaxID=673318 RepID=A0A2N5M012_9BACI|nr:PaaI family thioesterase [Peribacillus deserti]PLT27704.1 PaaI family thioesterase [Peribacillus deserti]